jgi:hypothetical protein
MKHCYGLLFYDAGKNTTMLLAANAFSPCTQAWGPSSHYPDHLMDHNVVDIGEAKRNSNK